MRPRGVRPQLLQKALALLPPHQAVVVALDTPRLGPWEVWLAGSVVAGRTRPIGWAVMPYPWPKGRCRATTIALIQRLQAAFSTWGALEPGRGPRLSACGLFGPMAPRGPRPERAAALQ